MHEEFPQHRVYGDAVFACVKDKPRFVEEHDGWAGVVLLDKPRRCYHSSEFVTYERLCSSPQHISEACCTLAWNPDATANLCQNLGCRFTKERSQSLEAKASVSGDAEPAS
jgi:hypothetical protein